MSVTTGSGGADKGTAAAIASFNLPHPAGPTEAAFVQAVVQIASPNPNRKRLLIANNYDTGAGVDILIFFNKAQRGAGFHLYPGKAPLELFHTGAVFAVPNSVVTDGAVTVIEES